MFNHLFKIHSKYKDISNRAQNFFLFKYNSEFQRLGKGLTRACRKEKDTTFVYDIYKSYLKVLKTAAFNIFRVEKYGPFEIEKI